MGKTIYKVCRREKNKYYSVNSKLKNSKFRLEYVIGKITKPKIGKIFAFEKLKDAEHFMKFFERNVAIFKAKGYGIEKVQEVLYYPSESNLQQFWNNENTNDLFTVIPKVRGIFVEKIKIIEIKKNLIQRDASMGLFQVELGSKYIFLNYNDEPFIRRILITNEFKDKIKKAIEKEDWHFFELLGNERWKY